MLSTRSFTATGQYPVMQQDLISAKLFQHKRPSANPCDTCDSERGSSNLRSLAITFGQATRRFLYAPYKRGICESKTCEEKNNLQYFDLVIEKYLRR